MNGSSNVLVLGVTGQVGKLVAKHLKRMEANFSAGSRRRANLEELADQFGASRFIDLDDPRTFDEAFKNVSSIVGVRKGRTPIFPRGRTRKNGVHRKRSRRYKDNSRSRTIVAAGMGKITRQ